MGPLVPGWASLCSLLRSFVRYTDRAVGPRNLGNVGLPAYDPPPVRVGPEAPTRGVRHDGAVNRTLPDHVTHYYVPGRPPFLNVSELTDAEWDVTRRMLDAERGAGDSSRVFGRRYRELRRATEVKLRDLFVAAGGRPERDAPHYFVLGSSDWFRGLARGMRELTIPLTALPEAGTSMTIPDSVTSMGLGGDFGIPVDPRPHHGRVFRLPEFADAIETYGLPEGRRGDYDGYQFRSFELYAEVQVWSDSVLGPLSPSDRAGRPPAARPRPT